MRQMTAPGLPTWPPLWFDAERKRAYIRARFATWRGHELGQQVTKVVCILNLIVCLIIAWKIVPEFDFFLWRLIAVVLTWAVIGALATRWLRHELPGLLARQLFAVTVRLFFTGEAIAFRSNLYRKGIVFARQWRDNEVDLQFSIDECPAAEAFLSSVKSDHQHNQSHLMSSRRLSLIVCGVDDRSRISGAESLIRKSVPVCEIQESEVKKLTVVCNAAQMLTEVEVGNAQYSHRPGIDIDVQ